MRVFCREDVRSEQALEGDMLHERWLAQHARGQQVVLLALRREHAARDDLRSAWLEQAARNAACSRPGLLPVVDHGTHGGTAFVAREHAPDALPLSALLEHLESQGEALPALLGVHVLRVLCDTLSDAHGLTIAGEARPLHHGDLAAERVLVRADGRLQLTELGLNASLLPPSPGVRVGDHVAPELARGAAVDALSDVYALGILLKRMLVPGSGRKSGATRALVPALPPPELVQLIARLAARAPGERPADMGILRQHLASLASHAAGQAVLAQLHEDARTHRPSVPVVRSSIPPAASVSTTKTALFVAPLAAGARADGRASPAREASGGFRGRTQVFGSPLLQAPALVAAPIEAAIEAPLRAPSPGPAPAPRAPALTATDQPALLAPISPPLAKDADDDMPPLLPGSGPAPRVASPRLDLTGMPPLISRAPSIAPAATEAVAAPMPMPVRAPEPVASAREPAPLPTRTVEQPAPRIGYDDAPALPSRVSSTPPANDNGFAAHKHESGLRLTSPTPPAATEAPQLALPDPLPKVEHFSSAPARKREKWREASETVFGHKVPAIMAQLAPRERMSPVLMFVIAMVVATVLIVGIRLLVGLIA